MGAEHGTSRAPLAGSETGIVFRDVGKSFGDLLVLDGITFEIERDSRIGIVGPSGGGKSTLLQIVAGLLEPSTAPSRSRERPPRRIGSRAAR